MEKKDLKEKSNVDWNEHFARAGKYVYNVQHQNSTLIYIAAKMTITPYKITLYITDIQDKLQRTDKC